MQLTDRTTVAKVPLTGLSSTAHDGCGVACYHLGRLPDAERHFRLALEHRPGDGEIARRITVVEKAIHSAPGPNR